MDRLAAPRRKDCLTPAGRPGASGGTPVTVAEIPPDTGIFFGGAWLASDTIVYTVFDRGGFGYHGRVAYQPPASRRDRRPTRT